MTSAPPLVQRAQYAKRTKKTVKLDMLLAIYCYLCSVNHREADAQSGVKPARADVRRDKGRQQI